MIVILLINNEYLCSRVTYNEHIYNLYHDRKLCRFIKGKLINIFKIDNAYNMIKYLDEINVIFELSQDTRVELIEGKKKQFPDLNKLQDRL